MFISFRLICNRQVLDKLICFGWSCWAEEPFSSRLDIKFQGLNEFGAVQHSRLAVKININPLYWMPSRITNFVFQQHNNWDTFRYVPILFSDVNVYGWLIISICIHIKTDPTTLTWKNDSRNRSLALFSKRWKEEIDFYHRSR